MTHADIIAYCRDNYGTEPEYPWGDLPEAGVLRHRDNAKWYGLFMSVTADKLGRKTHEMLELLNIKGDPDEIVHIREMDGFAPAYHMNKKHWLTVILGEITAPEVVYRLIEKSYDLTAPKRRKPNGGAN
jgi:predicted DNA-binding protein (MmcQ/YjbR family)